MPQKVTYLRVSSQLQKCDQNKPLGLCYVTIDQNNDCVNVSVRFVLSEIQRSNLKDSNKPTFMLTFPKPMLYN